MGTKISSQPAQLKTKFLKIDDISLDSKAFPFCVLGDFLRPLLEVDKLDFLLALLDPLPEAGSPVGHHQLPAAFGVERPIHDIEKALDPMIGKLHPLDRPLRRLVAGLGLARGQRQGGP
jgi:hypothetical protein